MTRPVDDETLADIASLCGKVAHDFESGPMKVDDLVELRDLINDVRAHVSRRGYKTLARLVRHDEEERETS